MNRHGLLASVVVYVMSAHALAFEEPANGSQDPAPIDAKNEAEKQRKEQAKKGLLQETRPIVLNALDRIRLAGDVPLEKRPLIRKEIEEALHQEIDKQVNSQRQIRNFNLDMMPRPASGPSLSRSIEKAADKAVEKHLSSEHLATYRLEITKRKEDFKRATILSMLSRIDSTLRLSGSQRADLQKVLEKEWKEAWLAWFSLHDYVANTVPAIPDRLIVPLLTPTQEKVWKSSSKLFVETTHFSQFSLGVVIVRDDYWGAEPAEILPVADPPAEEAAP
ncbi:hypothetical protein K2X85_08885 [bacterium]|nr:hypothetical protein [bacterium]